ncbi:pollen allergen [Nocardia tenerifensis]|uniref:Pollen allergen n=1 Tax=Nocardia tenerifensis TaxID=228006 RepID=A0A318JW95_9NOCA|nr:expansin EXLX1 family cellulose-binding protein [Nocardia tenerifensis]PXX58347.1 pollen allergen [Nocardia tenerifensis]
MHRIPIDQRHFRSGWLWSAVGLIAIAGAAVWLTRPEPPHCDTPNALEQSASTNVLAHSLTPRTPVAASSIGPSPQPVVSGQARFYSFSQGVSCSFPALPMDGFYVGMSTQEFGIAEPCGAYLDIEGPNGDVRALIVDRCPACAPGQLDLSVAAFTQIADLSDGVVPIRYRVVRDPEPPPELFYQVKPDSSGAWFAILFSGTGNPLREVAIRPSGGGTWRNLTHGMDNYWSLSGAGPGPFDARVTDVHGDRADIVGITLQPGVRATGAHLYSGAPAAPEPAQPQPIPSPTAAAQPSTSSSSANCRP